MHLNACKYNNTYQKINSLLLFDFFIVMYFLELCKTIINFFFFFYYKCNNKY